jgi:PAP2 superfamily
MTRTFPLLILILGLVSTSSSVGSAQELPPDEVLKWNEIAINAVRRDSTPPPLAARNLAILHGSIYDSVNAILRTHTVYRVSVAAPRRASPRVAAAASAHRVLVNLYPLQKQAFDQALRESLAYTQDGRSATDAIQIGRFVADQFLEWRSRDTNVPSAPNDSSPALETGLWRPTPPQFHKAALPKWGQVATFAVVDREQFRTEPPPALSSADYARFFNETKSLGAIDSQVRTDDQTEIAHFWADGANTCTPPGHWNEIARTVALDQANTLGQNARLFALLNISLADAAICCWECKFMFQFWRPITAIRNANDDNNADTALDADWTPLLETPPFPAYTSGHSSFSGAGSTVLAEFFGDNIPFQATSDALPGVKRSYSSFSEAAEEAGRSRIYGGIHWECDNSQGLAMGRSLGKYVYRTFLLDNRTARASHAPEEPVGAAISIQRPGRLQRGGLE